MPDPPKASCLKTQQRHSGHPYTYDCIMYWDQPISDAATYYLSYQKKNHIKHTELQGILGIKGSFKIQCRQELPFKNIFQEIQVLCKSWFWQMFKKRTPAMLKPFITGTQVTDAIAAMISKICIRLTERKPSYEICLIKDSQFLSSQLSLLAEVGEKRN